MDCHFYKNNHCRSCELLDRSYDDTLKLKEAQLFNLFPGIESVTAMTVGLEEVKGTRNKAKFAVGPGSEFGFYDSSLHFKDLEECPLHMEGLNALLPYLKTKCAEYNIVPYSLTEKKGEFKYLIISKSASHHEFLIRFVMRSKESLDRLKKMAKVLQAERPDIKVVTANIQPEHKAVLEGAEEIVLTENSVIMNQFGDVKLTLGPRSFFQVTPEIAEKLYSAVGERVKELQIKSFLDLYCGVGAFSFFAARNCPKVFGVEISADAIECAKKSIPLNQTGEINFAALDVEEFLKSQSESFDAILVNPPRRGLNPSIVENIKANSPRVIFYSSCNAETLARDYESLKSKYDIHHVQIFDMFPFTTHFETLIILNRKDV